METSSYNCTLYLLYLMSVYKPCSLSTIWSLIFMFLHFRAQYDFLTHLAKFQSITNIRSMQYRTVPLKCTLPPSRCSRDSPRFSCQKTVSTDSIMKQKKSLEFFSWDHLKYCINFIGLFPPRFFRPPLLDFVPKVWLRIRESKTFGLFLYWSREHVCY